MKQEDKELFLRDLCARLPYKVKVTTTNAAVRFGVISGISFENKISVRTKHADIVFNCTEVKPYLFPMSSMTEEQFLELTELCNMYDNYNDYNPYEYWGIQVCCKHIHGNKPCFSNNYKAIDWLNKNHFDYRGLIPMGLALDATVLNVY